MASSSRRTMAARPGSSRPLPTASRRIPIKFIVIASALIVLVWLTSPSSASSSASAAASVDARRSPPRFLLPWSSRVLVVSSKKTKKNNKKTKSSTSPPPSSSLSLNPATSDRERGWPPFYPRRFPPTTNKESDESVVIGAAPEEAKSKNAKHRSLPAPPTPPSSRSATTDDASKVSVDALPASASTSKPSNVTASSTPSAKTSSAPSLGSTKAVTFFRRSRALFTLQREKNNETSPAVVEQVEEEKSTTTTATTPLLPSKEEAGGSSTAVVAVDNETSRSGTNASSVGDRSREITNGTTSVDLSGDEARNHSILESHNASSSTQDVASTSAATQQQQPQPQEQPQQQPAGGLILLGTPPPSIPYRIYRRGTAGGTGGGLAGLPGTAGWDPTTAPPSPGRGGTPATPASNAAVVFAELATSVLGTVTRILLLRSITGWLAKQEEAMAPTQHFVWECLNDRYLRDESALTSALSAPPAGVSGAQWRRQLRARMRRIRRAQHERAHRLRQRERGLSSAAPVDGEDVPLPPGFLDPAATYLRTVVVLELTGEGKDGPDNAHLADIVTFLLSRHRNHAFGTNATDLRPTELEVVVLVQSPGGSVAAFGLAAAQVRRLSQEPGIFTTVCVDKYAASGGYMIASQAHQLIAAPFASVGSVGVILEGLNFNELARKYGVQPLVIKAGESKNPITTFGSITKQDMDHQKDQLEKVHVAFKELVVQGRPALAERLEQVANGNVFLGEEARALDLVDRVATSSQYLMERVEMGDRVLKLHRSSPSRFPRRVGTLSPLDILPHLRSRFAHLGSEVGHILNQRSLPTWIVQGATYVSLCHHLYAQYLRSR